jgi:hypothetical protein
MRMFLFACGILATAAGAAMVGFGISIKEFSLGNTLLTTGTVAIVGGLILVGIATAIQELQRIAEALAVRPPPRASRSLDAFEPAAPAALRAAPPPDPMPSPSIEPAKESAFAAPRMPFSLPPHDDEKADETSLSPRTAPTPEVAAAPERGNKGDVLSVSRLDLSFRPAPPREADAPKEFFDSLWPAPVRANVAADTPAAPEASSADAPPPQQEAEPAPAKEADPVEEAQAVTILKSGIIDEMAYTLYSDGSIEAEMPQGTMRFGSIADLRSYLEKSA